MAEHYLDENENGDILICDENGRVIQRFRGDDALQAALTWAKDHALVLRANISMVDLFDQTRFFARHRGGLFAVYKDGPYRNPQDPPNVQRLIFGYDFNFNFDDSDGDFEDWSDEDDVIYIMPGDPIGEDVELAPEDTPEDDDI